MTERSPEQVGANWDKVGRKYGQALGPRLAHYTQEALKMAPLPAGARVLDVATGPGTMAIAAARGGARVVATDFSQVMVDQVAARAQAEGLAGRVEARVMDGQALDLPDDSFDAAFSMFGLMIFPDRAAGFKEVHRVLKPGGRALVAVWDKPPRNGWLSLFQQAIATALPDAPPPPPPSFMELADPGRLAAEMGGAGFGGVKVHEVDHAIDFGPPEGMWEVCMETNPAMPGMVERLGPNRVGAVRAALDKLAKEKAAADGADTVRLHSTALMGVGVK